MTVALSMTTGCETVAVKWSSERLRSLERAWSRVTCRGVSTGTVMGSERSESAAVAVIKPAKASKAPPTIRICRWVANMDLLKVHAGTSISTYSRSNRLNFADLETGREESTERNSEHRKIRRTSTGPRK